MFAVRSTLLLHQDKKASARSEGLAAGSVQAMTARPDGWRDAGRQNQAPPSHQPWSIPSHLSRTKHLVFFMETVKTSANRTTRSAQVHRLTESIPGLDDRRDPARSIQIIAVFWPATTVDWLDRARRLDLGPGRERGRDWRAGYRWRWARKRLVTKFVCTVLVKSNFRTHAWNIKYNLKKLITQFN